MGNVKYSKIATSNGAIVFKQENNFKYEKEFDSYEYIKIYNIIGRFKIYINNSTDYIYLCTGEELILQDFSINSIKIENERKSYNESIMYYVCK